MRKVLFVCGENSARSQMAEAFFNAYARGWKADSAGTFPAWEVKPLAVEAMREVNVDISRASTKPLDLDTVEDYARIVSFGCIARGTFPVPDRLEEWAVEDPGQDDMQGMRMAREEIERRVKKLLKELERKH